MVRASAFGGIRADGTTGTSRECPSAASVAGIDRAPDRERQEQRALPRRTAHASTFVNIRTDSASGLACTVRYGGCASGLARAFQYVRRKRRRLRHYRLHANRCFKISADASCASHRRGGGSDIFCECERVRQWRGRFRHRKSRETVLLNSYAAGIYGGSRAAHPASNSSGIALAFQGFRHHSRGLRACRISGVSAQAAVSGRSDTDSATAVLAQAAIAASGSRPGAKGARQQPTGPNKPASNAPATVFSPTTVTVPLLDVKDTGASAVAEAPVNTVKPAVNQTANADATAEVSHPPAVANAPLAPDIEMAFAVRVQPAPPAGAEPSAAQVPLQHEIAASAQPSLKKIAETDAAAQTVVQPAAGGAASFLASYGNSFTHAETAAPATTPPPTVASSAPAKPIEARVETPKSGTVPLKDISLQVAQSGNQKVEVRLVQQSGELRVAVHTADPDLAHGLQQGLSDLVGRLQDSGSHAEAWRPGASTIQSGPAFESRTSPGGSQTDDSRSYSGGSHQQQDERRQNQSQRPGWVEELESSITGGEQSQGATYGIGS